MSSHYCGQYLATFESNGQQGNLVINIDRDRLGQGVAYLSLNTQDPLNFLVFDCSISDNRDGVIVGTASRSQKLENLHGKNSEISAEDSAPFQFELNKNVSPHNLRFQYREAEHQLTLFPIVSENKTKATQVTSWSEYVDWVNTIRSTDRQAIFRGVSRSSYGLKTSFHRTGRVDIERYRDSDLPTFRDLAETIGGIRLNDAPADNAALWGFAQHHGFPTPLLDWTESPYIAAYFAFAERLEHQDANKDDPVKIYYLNGKFVEANCPPIVNMADVFPRVWILKPSSKGNQRLIFQQGLFLHSNIEDIEAYLMYLSEKNKVTLLSAVEVPASIAREAIDELAYMGVSHLSLFPGLDGAAKHATFKQFYLPARS